MRAIGLVVMLTVLAFGCGIVAKGPRASDEEALLEKADAVRGGALYDRWWVVLEVEPPLRDHPLWSRRPDRESNERIGATTWRCKECHGWDYAGVDGAYGSGSHRTGFGGILGSEMSPPELLEELAVGHGYRAAGLSDDDLRDLIRFVREEAFDTRQLIDEGGLFRGEAARGVHLYEVGVGENVPCVVCHGEEGVTVPADSDPDHFDDFVGKVAVGNPWEFLHKVRFGQPGAKMPAAAGSGITLEQLGDLGAHAQRLPEGP